jgi:hypothetical protein
MAVNGATTTQVELAQQVLGYFVAAGRWRGRERVGWRNNTTLHDQLLEALEELPEDLEENLQRPLRHQLLELHRVQEDSNWVAGPITAATVALKDLLRAVVEVEFAVLAGGPALGDGDVVPYAGDLEGMVVQLDERFLIVHYGVKAPLEVPSPPSMQPSPVVAVELAPSVDDGVAQLAQQPEDQAPPVTPDCPECDAEVAVEPRRFWWEEEHALEGDLEEEMIMVGRLTVDLEDAVVFTAPQWHRTRRGHGHEGEGGSVALAGWSELSDAVTVLHMVTMWHVVRPQLKMHAACGQGGLQYDRGVACEHLPPSGMVHSVYRYMDTHRPVKVGGGYRPPQDRPPPVVCS